MGKVASIAIVFRLWGSLTPAAKALPGFLNFACEYSTLKVRKWCEEKSEELYGAGDVCARGSVAT
eukprot:6208537-Pleurochrysis_carterae.AAC.1